jgi:uncharacterized Zn-binding protein involved in type VI secretion
MKRAVIRLGDRTSHGGVVVTGDQTINVFGKPAARKGDMVSCPKCNGTFPIVEGSLSCGSDRELALDGMRTSCGAILLASQQFWLEEYGTGASTPPEQADQSPTERPDEPTKQLVYGMAQVSFYIQDRRQPIGIGRLAAELLADRSPEHVKRFIELNDHLGKYAQYGSIVLVSSDYENENYTAESMKLIHSVKEVESLRAKLAAHHVQTMFDNWDLLAYAIGQNGDNVVGAAGTFLKTYGQGIKSALDRLEGAAQQALARSGNLRDAQFRAERAAILADIDTKFKRMLLARAGIPDRIKLSAALNLSSKSVTHIWRSGGTPIYVRYHGHIVKWFQKYEARATKLAIAYSAGKAGNEVYKVCSDESKSQKECMIASSSETLGLATSIGTGTAAASGGLWFCTMLIPAGGAPGLICAVGVVGASIWAGSAAGDTGKQIGAEWGATGYELLFE